MYFLIIRLVILVSMRKILRMQQTFYQDERMSLIDRNPLPANRQCSNVKMTAKIAKKQGITTYRIKNVNGYLVRDDRIYVKCSENYDISLYPSLIFFYLNGT